MRRAYVIIGIRWKTGTINDVYAVAHSQARAEELCAEAEDQFPQNYYTWYEAVEEDD